MDHRTTGNRLAVWQWLGVCGSVLVAVGGVFVGVGPTGDAVQLPHDATAAILWPTALAYAGMTLLLIAWWALGRVVRGPGRPPVRDLIGIGVLWAVPFALSGPIFSRDVYSYLAQGAMTVAGLDPYRFGPSAFGGELATNVPPIWQDTPAPYGPVFLRLAGAVTTVTGQEVWPGLIGMRLLALAGIVLIAVAVPRIARHCGVDPSAALWLGVLNPLVLLHLVVDAHNEALMIGLMCAGLLSALRRRPVLGAVLITLAGLVKGPALVALAFVAVLWAGRLAGRARWVRAAGATLVTAAGTAAAVTALTGTGFGWIPALRTPTRAHTWMSVTTDLGSLLGHVLDRLGLATMGETRHAVWGAGFAAAGLISLVLLRRCVTDGTAESGGTAPGGTAPGGTAVARGPVAALGLCLTALVILGPVVHAWYLLWGVVPLAAAGSDRVRRVVAGASPVLVLVAPPNDAPVGAPLVFGALLGIAAGLLAHVVFAYGRRQSARRDGAPRAAGPLVSRSSGTLQERARGLMWAP